jgi:regulator of protease activity HflC (stomatin/prohibitin superfamily)
VALEKMSFFRFIPTNSTGIHQRFGRFIGMAKPGLKLFLPIIDTVTLVDNRLKQDVFSFEVKTSDDVFTLIELKVQYRIKTEHSERAFFSLENPREQIDAYIENVVRATAPSMTLNMLYEEQDAICESVSGRLSSKMQHHGFTIENTLITSIDPDKRVKDSMNAIYASERQKVATKNEADAHYIEQVRKAEGDKERKRLQGEGVSAQRKAIIDGYERGIDNMATALGLTPAQIVDFVLKTQHLDALEAIGRSSNCKTIFLAHDPNKMQGVDFAQAQEITQNKQ